MAAHIAGHLLHDLRERTVTIAWRLGDEIVGTQKIEQLQRLEHGIAALLRRCEQRKIGAGGVGPGRRCDHRAALVRLHAPAHCCGVEGAETCEC